jgi:hypothetical protein
MVSCVGNMAELFLRTPTTLDCNAISARSIISAYVDLTSELRGTHGFVHASAKPSSVIGTPAYHSLSAPLSPFPGLVALHPDTRSLGRPCGLACPALPRYSEGMAGIGQWRWGGLVTNMGMVDETLNVMSRTDIRYSTGVSCANQYCSVFGGVVH